MRVRFTKRPGRALAGTVALLSLAAAQARGDDFGGADYSVVRNPFAAAEKEPAADPEGEAVEPDGAAGSAAEDAAPLPAPGGSMDDLRARIEALERQNQELIRRLDAGGPTGGRGADAADGPTDVEEESGGAGGDGQGSAGAKTVTASESSGVGKAKVADGRADGGEDEGDGWYEIGSDLGMTGSWKHGLEFSSKNKDFRVHVGGRIQFDGVWFDDSPAFDGTGGVGDADAVDFRRARLRVDGTMYEWIDWATEFDFVNTVNVNQNLEPASNNNVNVSNVPAPTDLWMNFKGLPYVGNLRVGNMKEPIGMEHQSSSRFLPFLERSFGQDVFYGQFNNGFTPGVMLWDTFADQRGTWATGFFKDTNNPFAFDANDGDYAWTSRLTYLLWYDECNNGRSLFHVGVSNSLRDPAGNTARFRTRPSLRNGPGALNPVLADTGRFPVDTADFGGLEAAWNYGPFNMQAEYTPGFLYGAVGNRGPFAGRPIGNEFIQGGYVQALYFLTGEHMTYDRSRGAFDRITPNENAYVLKGLRGNIFAKGAWQVGFRYSYLDLASSAALNGGILNDYTFGLNWYLNPNVKVQWNYVLTHRDVPAALGTGGYINGFGTRLAYDF